MMSKSSLLKKMVNSSLETNSIKKIVKLLCNVCLVCTIVKNVQKIISV
jgi:hypothetical protein